VLKGSYALTYTQIGLITLAFQLTSSVLQPLVGLYTDRRPLPCSLAVGMGITLIGLLLLSAADSFPFILAAAALVGVGSAVFHPEASRMARLASGGRHGLAQSLFQVGGNGGSALGPLMAAFVVVRWGQGSLAWFSIAAVAAMVILLCVGKWYQAHLAERRDKKVVALPSPVSGRLRRGRALVPDLLEVLLPGEPDQLLHPVPDRHVRSGRRGLSVTVVRVPRGGGSRDVSGRAQSATGSGSRR
jgi:FSR family fosmidomycin resistance protein-like MFS transporter